MKNFTPRTPSVVQTEMPAMRDQSIPPRSNWLQGLHVASMASVLEQRVMLDAAGLQAMDAIADDAAANDDAMGVADEMQTQQPRHEVVIVDSSIDNHEALLLDIEGADDPSRWTTDPDTGIARLDTVDDNRLITVYAINGNTHGFETINEVLGNESSVDTLHILSHGENASILFGQDRIDLQALEQNPGQISNWGTALNANADILLYGCHTAGTDAGEAFVNAFADATDADVAASDDATGNAAHQGDYELEYQAGSIESGLVTEEAAQAAFEGTLASTPTATLTVPAEQFINESFNFTVNFDNTGTDTGYEPFIDLFAAPGVDIDSASYLGSSLPIGDVYTWDAASTSWLDTGSVALTENPLNTSLPLPADPGVDGMQWYIMDLPFGSFVPDQPVASVLINASLSSSDGAVVGTPLTISARAGFEFGEDAFDNPDTDAPINGTLATSSITPSVIALIKTASNQDTNAVGSESEHATGPNNPITYEITVDIADGETVDSVVISDAIPDHIHYLGNLQVSGTGTQAGENQSPATVGASSGNTLSVSFTSVTGTSATNDVVVEFDGYIPLQDAAGASVINPVTGTPAPTITNTAVVNATYSGNSLSDTDDVDITPKALATQKTVSVLDSSGNPAGRSTTIPGDLLEWRIVVEVSDYFSLDSFLLDDTFSDGHLYVAGSERLSVFTNGVTVASTPFAPANVNLGTISSGTGDTLVNYDVGAQLIAELGTDQLDGDLATESAVTDKTQFVVTFRTEVQENFQHASVFGGDSSVDIGDRLDNGIVATAQVASDGASVSDGSGASVFVTSPDTTKSIYAINGDTNDFDPADPELAPGQTVTYRITITLPTVDVENLVITDYMPLPVYQVPGTYTYGGFFSAVDDAPVAGQFGFGPATDAADFPAGFFDSTNGTDLDIVSVTTNSASNSIVWDFDSFDDPASQGGVIDLLFTTVIENVQFGDGLTLTNQAQVAFDNTNNPIEPINSIVQIETLSPDLNITKGVVATDAATTGTFSAAVGPVTFSDAGTVGTPFSGTISSAGLGATPIDADIEQIDAGDTIRFALTLENTGGFSATDIQINDDFQAGFAIPSGGLNLQAHLGDGTPLIVIGDLFNSSGVADSTGVSFETTASNETILGKGRDDITPTADGTNIIVVTYDLEVLTTAVSDAVLQNDVNLLSFAAFDGGVDYTAGSSNAQWSDSATATLSVASIDKTFVSSSVVTADNTNAQAVNGEYLIYQVVIAIPEGTMPLSIIQDTLDTGLAFDSLISITPSSGDVTTDIAGGFSNAVIPSQGDTGRVDFDLGTLTNANTSNGTTETLTLSYQVYVLASASVGATLNNRADLRWDRNDDGNNLNDGLERDRAATVEVISPLLAVDKIIVGAAPADAGDSVTYQITIQHVDLPGTADDSDADAYDASFNDTLPATLNSVTLDSVVDQNGATVNGFSLSGNTISNANFDLVRGDEIIITASAIASNVIIGADITNTATVNWSSLDDAVPSSGEFSEALAGTESDSVSFSIDSINVDKTLVSTGINTTNNGTSDVVQGEFATYRVVIDVPEGTTLDAFLVDTLPNELTFDPAFTPTITSNSADISYSGATPAAVITGQEMRIDFNDIINANRSNAAGETITVEYRAFVNSGTTTVDTINTATLRWDLDGNGSAIDPTDGVATDTSTITFKQPELQVANTLSTKPSDAGDTAVYSVVIEHAPASNADALEASFTNTLPAQFTGINSFTAVDGSGSPVTGFSVTGNTLSNGDFDLALGDSIILTINGTVNTSAAAGSTVTDTASIDWDSLGDNTEGSQAAQFEGTGTNSAAFTVDSPTITRTISSTGISNTSNTDTQVVAGEFVTYQLVIDVPEGTTNLASIIDTLDPELALDTGFTVNATGSTGVTISNANPLTPSVTGDDVQFDLGQIVNSNTDDAVTDTVTLTYRVYVENTVSSGDILNASAQLIWDINDNTSNTDGADGDATEGTGVNVTVLSPELTLSKVTSIAPADGGDTVNYQLVIAHTAASETGAFDATFSDTLPSEISSIFIVSVVNSGGAPVGGFSVNGNTVSGDFDLLTGDTLTIRLHGTVNSTAVASSTVTNTANIDWDTLGDDAQGNQAAEQTGGATAQSDFTVASPTFEKTVLSTGINTVDNDNLTAVAGEYVTYQLAVTVPEGQTKLVNITDILDANTTYDTSFTVQYTTPAGVSVASTPAAATVSGNTLTFDLGNIDNTNTDNGSAGATAETVLITYRTFVANGLTSGTLTDTATLLWDSDNDGSNTGDSTLTDSTSVTVTQPELLVEKELTQTPSDTGDDLTYTVLIRHTDSGDAPVPASGATAHDVTLSDPVPVGVTNVQILSAVDENGDAVTGFTVAGDDASGYVVTHAGFELDNGSTVLVTLTGVAGPAITEGETLVNTASIGWTSLDDDAALDGNDAAETSETDSDAVGFSISDVSKSIVSTSISTTDNTDLQAVAGEYINYQIVVTVPQGTSNLATIDDVLDAGLVFDSANAISVVASSANLTTNLPQSDFSGVNATLDAGSNTLSFELGDITNSSTGATVETLTVNYRVFVDDNATTAGQGEILGNQATYRWDINGNSSHDDAEDGQTTAAAAGITVLAPVLIVDNTVSQAPGVQGDAVEYTVVIRHSDMGDTGTPLSDANAFDTVFASTYPAGVTGLGVVAVDNNGDPVSGFSFTGNTLNNSDFDLALGETITLTVTGTAGTGLSNSEEYISNATVTWTTLDAQDTSDGNDAAEADDTDSDSASFSLASLQKTIQQTGIDDASNDNVEVVTGEYVYYQLVVDLAQGTSALAAIEDTLDDGLIFDSSYGVNITPSSSAVSTSLTGGDFSTATAVVDGASNSLSIALGDITNASSGSNPEQLTVVYRVFVDDSVNAVQGSTLNNSALYRWDIDGNGDATDSTDGLATDTAADVTVISTELNVTNTLTTTPVDAGDTAVFSIVIEHTPASQAAAFDNTFVNALPSQYSGVSILSSVDSANNPVAGFTVSGNTVENTDFDLALGETITLTVQATVNDTAAANQLITDTATITWDSLGDSSQGNQAVEAEGTANDSASFTMTGPTISRSILDTGITTADNSDLEVVAGEFVTYQLIVEVPEGTTNLASIIDTIDPALSLDTGFTVNATGSTGVTVGNANPVTAAVSGNDILFDLGQIVNSNTDDSAVDTVTLTYRVYTDNTVSPGDILNASAQLIWDIDSNSSNSDVADGSAAEGAGVNVTVLRPELTLSKVTSTAPADGGDTVNYQLVIAHTGASETGAYDATITDILPSEISSVSIVSALDSGGAAVTGFSVTGNTVSGVFDLLQGETITLQVTGTLNSSAIASTTVTNTASLDWDTLGDDTQGNQAEEQTGVASAQSDFILASPEFEKTILSTGINIADNDNLTVVAGEYVTYQLAVTVPEGQTQLVNITDVLDANVTYDTSFAVQYTTPSGVTLTNAPTAATVSGSTLTFDLGTIGNVNADNGAVGATPELVLITYRAFVANGLTSGTLSDAATLLWDSDGDGSNTGDSTLSSSTLLSVTQAELRVEKDLTQIPSDTGDNLTYTVLIRHADATDAPAPVSATSAYDVALNDPVPVGINNVQIASAVDENGNAVSGFTVTGDDANGYVVSHNGFNLDNGSTVLVTLTGETGSAITEGETLTNTAVITWSSLDDDNALDGNDSVETTESDSDSAGFSISDASKSIVSTGITTGNNTDSQAVAGEYINYQIVLTVPQGTSDLAAVDDVLDAGLVFDSANPVSVVASSTNVTTSLPQSDFSGVSAMLDAGSNTLSFELGDITNTSAGSTVETLTVTYRVFVADDAITAAQGQILDNQSTFRWDIDGNGSHDDAVDGLTTVAAPVVEVLAPILIVDNDVSQPPGVRGDAIEYTIVIRHSEAGDTGIPLSDADAFDSDFSTTFPTGITGLGVSAIDGNGNPVSGFTFTGNTLNNTDFDLALGETITLTVTGTADSVLAISEEHIASSTINWTTLDAQDPSDGNDATEAENTDTDTASFSLASLQKTILQTGISDVSNDNTEAVTGEYVYYQLVVDLAQGTSALAVIEDTLDNGLVFDSTYGVNITPSSSAVSTSLAGGDFSTATATVDGASNSLSIVLGDISNTSMAANNEHLTIVYRVFVDDSTDAAIGSTLNNSAQYRWDINGNGDATDTIDGLAIDSANDVTVIDTELSITNTMSTTPVDAGDTTVFTLVIEHTATSQAAAFDNTFVNTLPSQYSSVSILSSVDSAANPVNGFVVNGNTVENPDFDLPLGDTITLTVQATVNDTAVANQLITDTATITWDSLGDSTQGNQIVEAQGTSNDTASFTMSGPSFSRAIVDTGITNLTNTDGQVVAGEYITYNLVVTVPEGTTPTAAITDTLATNLAFDPSYVISATGSAGVTFSGGDPINPVVSGDSVAFDLGTIVNSNTVDSTPDTVTILYRVFVEPTVTDGDTLTADSLFAWPSGSLADSSTIAVIAPELHIDKAVTLVPSDVGDTIEYEIHIRHTSPADGPAVSRTDAFDITFLDDIPAGIENVTVISAVDAAGNPVTGFTTTGNQVTHASFDLALSDTVTITLQGMMGESLTEGDTIRNEALINWTTLDLAADDGIDTAELTSSATDDASFSLGDIAKSIVSTGITDDHNNDLQAVPGEYIHYRIVVDIPQGTQQIAQILDTLDAGLIFDTVAPVSVTPSSTNVSTSFGAGDFSDITPSHSVTDNALTFNLGTISNTAPAGITETLTIDYRAYVANDATTAPAASSLNNEVLYRWDIDNDGSNTGTLDGLTETVSAPITVLTPQLNVENTVTTIPGQHGDTITYTYIIAHNSESTATAYDVSFIDTLPAGLESLSVVSAVDSNNSPISGFSVLENVLSHDSLDIVPGDTVTITVTGTVGVNTPVSETVVTHTDIAWTSLDADNADDGSDIAADANEFSSTATTTSGFSVADIQTTLVSSGIENTDNATSDVVAGEYAVYSVTIDIPEGVSSQALFVATLEDGLRFDQLLSVESNSSLLTSTLDPASPTAFSNVVAPVAGSEGELMFELGTINNGALTNNSAEQLTILYRVYVDDVPANTAGTTLLTHARFQWDIDGDGSSVGDLDGSTTETPEQITLQEPVIDIIKNVSDSDPHLSQRVTYTVDVQSENRDFSADAFDLTLADTLPDDVALDLASIRINGVPAAQYAGASNTSDGNTVSLALDSLTKGETLQVTYDAVVTSDTARTNTSNDSPMEATWTSLSALDAQDGNELAERNATSGYQAADSAGITILAVDYSLNVSSSSTDNLAVGDPVTYTLDIANTGTHPGTGIVVVQQWPQDALDAPASISDNGSYDPATGRITWLINTLDVAQTMTLTVTGNVTQAQDADIDVDPTSVNDIFTSDVSITDDGSHGPEPDLSDNTSSVTDSVEAAPAYAVTIDNDITMAAVTQLVPYNITLVNEGDQQGTDVVLVHTFDPTIVQITEADGGVVDAQAGTVTWNIPLLQVGEQLDFRVEASVIPTANLTTSEQLFMGSVSASDNEQNGPDKDPSNNTAEHTDMLLSGPGDPIPLLGALPDNLSSSITFDSLFAEEGLYDPDGQEDSSGLTRVSSNALSILSSTLSEQDTNPADQRYLANWQRDGAEHSNAPWEDDVLNGGDLLDTFVNPVQTCEPVAIDWSRWYPTGDDVSSLEIEQGEDAGMNAEPSLTAAKPTDHPYRVLSFEEELGIAASALHPTTEPTVVKLLRNWLD